MRQLCLQLAALQLATISLAAQEPAPQRISGSAVDTAGAPIPNAVVTPRYRDDPGREGRRAPPPESTTTDAKGAKGAWTLQVDQPVVTVAVQAKGYARVVVQQSQRLPSWGTIALPPASTIVGRIRSADGLPLAGARVWAMRPGRMLNSLISQSQEVWTDDEGSFRLDAVPRVPVTVRAQRRATCRSRARRPSRPRTRRPAGRPPLRGRPVGNGRDRRGRGRRSDSSGASAREAQVAG